jgi:hypothetical protein
MTKTQILLNRIKELEARVSELDLEAENKLLREGLEFARCEIPGETERDRKLGLYKR